MSRDGLFIRGFAAPFGAFGRVRGELEVIAPYAFDLAGAVIDLRCEHNGPPFASTSDRSLVLAQNDHGLTFEAALPAHGSIWAWLDLMRRGELGASVSMPEMHRRPATFDGAACHRIDRARLDHVAVSPNPCFRDTAVWVSSWDPDDMPPRLRAEAARWAEPGRPPVPAKPKVEPAASARVRHRPSAAVLARITTNVAQISTDWAQLESENERVRGPAEKKHPTRNDVAWDSAGGVWRRTVRSASRGRHA